MAFSPPQASIGEFKVQTSHVRRRNRPHAGFAGQHQHQGRNQRHPRIGLVVDPQQEVRHAHDFPEPLRTEPAAVHRQSLRLFGRRPRVYPQGLQRQEPDLLAVHLGGQQVRRSQRRRDHLHCAARGLEKRRPLRPAETRRSVPDLRSRHDRGSSQRALQPHAVRRQHHPDQPDRPDRQEHPGALPAAQPGGHHRRPQQLLHLRPHDGKLLDDDRPRRSRVQREGPHVHPRATAISGWRTRTTTSSTIRPARTSTGST